MVALGQGDKPNIFKKKKIVQEAYSQIMVLLLSLHQVNHPTHYQKHLNLEWIKLTSFGTIEIWL